jgi:homogentisate 1,2-dioxygenase
MTNEYMSGFGNEFATEAIEGSLPEGQNTPQRVAHGLYAEQLTGSAFTAPRGQNKRGWLYRIRPSVIHEPFQPIDSKLIESSPFNDVPSNPSQMRWSPVEMPSEKTDIIDGIVTMAGGGDSNSWAGLAAHIYAANSSMENRYFYNADGEMLFVLQQGRAVFRTEMGIIDAAPGEIVVVPRGIRFAVDLPDGESRGYICENYGAPFEIPSLGPIGANGLANPRDFLTPVAAYEDDESECEIIAKFSGKLWSAKQGHSPLDVVAWHGNYAPYKYDLSKFNVINTVSFDHLDPSIFTVLTSPSYPPGTANIDFVIFPPRWMVAKDTFRPPYFHRNLMSEFMGIIEGIYDAKEGGGFIPGGSSLHNCMSPHGPDSTVFEKESNKELKPIYLKDTMAFMFESRFIMHPTKYASGTDGLQKDYYKCWQDLPKQFGTK